jgi:hypothetical protein
VPTRHCIEHYNKYQGHEKASKFRSQTLLLENQIFYLNRQIKKINHEKFKVCIKIKIKIHLKWMKTTTQWCKQMPPRSQILKLHQISPDILRQTKLWTGTKNSVLHRLVTITSRLYLLILYKFSLDSKLNPYYDILEWSNHFTVL